MAKLTVELEWNEEDLGQHWFNIDNLAACLFSEQHTYRGFLTVVKVVGVDGEQPAAADRIE